MSTDLDTKETIRKLIAAFIGYEMACEGKRTGTDISYGVMHRLREYANEKPTNLLLLLDGLGLDVEEGYLDPNKRGNVAVLWPLAIEEIAAPGKLKDWKRGFVVSSRGEATDA